MTQTVRRAPSANAWQTLALTLALTEIGNADAYDIGDKVSVNLLLAGAGQCQQVAGLEDSDNICRGAVPVQPEIAWNPTEQDEVFLKLGFAAGNGLNQNTPFVLAPWGADLEDDVKNINGRDRSYLLQAWYAHRFRLAADNSVQLTGGIVDSTAYLNRNAFADDEYTQFMNEVFVNARTAAQPAYDLGGALVWQYKNLTFSGVGMNIGENADGNNYNYYAGELGYRLATPMGEGNYRIMYSETSREFLDPTGQALEHRAIWVLSFDQELGSVVGAFLRVGQQSDAPLVDYNAEYSGGLNIEGSAWGREKDNVGIGFAYLQSPRYIPSVDEALAQPPDPSVEGTLEAPNEAARVLARTNVFETYYRFVVNDYLAVTADVQYMEDKYREGDPVEGWIFGLRAVVEL